jgi:hypothetical protein
VRSALAVAERPLCLAAGAFVNKSEYSYTNKNNWQQGACVNNCVNKSEYSYTNNNNRVCILIKIRTTGQETREVIIKKK